MKKNNPFAKPAPGDKKPGKGKAGKKANPFKKK